MSVLSLALFGCFDSSSEQAAPAAVTTPTPPPAPAPIVGNAADGLVYYNNNCAVCHAAGTTDPSSVFTASDLKVKGNSSKLIVSNMSEYSKTHDLMKKFDNVPVQRVADLNAYLNR